MLGYGQAAPTPTLVWLSRGRGMLQKGRCAIAPQLSTIMLGNTRVVQMTLHEETIAKISQLPESLVKEVNDFVDLLIIRWQEQTKGSTQQDELAKTEHPWLKFAGMYENNPLFADVLADIATNRCELDAERESEAVNNLQEQAGCYGF